MILTIPHGALFFAASFIAAAPACQEDGLFVEDVKVIHELRGEAAGDQFGWIARRVEDADGDGIADFTISAPFKAIDGQASCGRVYTYSGRSGKQLWQVTGTPGSVLGINVDSAGDVNGDGHGDVIAGAPGAASAFVYSGVDGSVLLHMKSPDPGRLAFGRTAAMAGDVNNDGHDDVIVGSPRHDAKGANTGRVYLYSGKDGSTLHMFEGEAGGNMFGSTISGYSDDDHSTLIIGAQNAGEGQRGRVYVYDGRSHDLKFTIEAESTGVNFGRMFASVLGDVNGDGVPDVYASDWEDNTTFQGAGRLYIVSGVDGSPLHAMSGEAAGDGYGIGNGDAGDVDGDGKADFIIGAWQEASGATSGGKCYLYAADGTLLRTYTSTVAQETWGFDTTGMGDVDGDGTVDLLITSAYSGINGAQSGRVFVISSGVKKGAATSQPATP